MHYDRLILASAARVYNLLLGACVRASPNNQYKIKTYVVHSYKAPIVLSGFRLIILKLVLAEPGVYWV